MADSIDQQFVEFVVKSLVSHPDDVKIERSIDEGGVLLQLTVNPEDLGRVIGKRGATAQSIRTLLRALGTKNQAKYNFKIIDNGEPRERREQRSETPTAPAPAPTTDGDTVATAAPVADDQATATEEPTPEPAQEVAEEATQESSSTEDDTTSLAEKTMKELQDLDDLEV